MSARSPTIKRIHSELRDLSLNPPADFTASPVPANLHEWHFTLRGPPSPSAFAGGVYHGRIVLPPTYPLRPPMFRFLTPSGRFEVNREICLSISGHHEETWQPAWGIRTALTALRAFMHSDGAGQLGGVAASEEVRRRLAGESAGWRCATCGKGNGEIMREADEAREALEASRSEEEKKKKKKPGEEAEGGGEAPVPEELRLGYRDELAKGAGERRQEDQSPVRSSDGQTGKVAMHTEDQQRQQQQQHQSGGGGGEAAQSEEYTKQAAAATVDNSAEVTAATAAAAASLVVAERSQPQQQQRRRHSRFQGEGAGGRGNGRDGDLEDHQHATTPAAAARPPPPPPSSSLPSLPPPQRRLRQSTITAPAAVLPSSLPASWLDAAIAVLAAVLAVLCVRWYVKYL